MSACRGVARQRDAPGVAIGFKLIAGKRIGGRRVVRHAVVDDDGLQIARQQKLTREIEHLGLEPAHGGATLEEVFRVLRRIVQRRHRGDLLAHAVEGDRHRR